MENKIWIVAQREFATRVKKRSFIVMTVLMPFLMAALVFLPMALSMLGGGRKTVAVVDATGRYVRALKSSGDYLFVPAEKMTAAFRSDSTDVDAVLQITADLADFPEAAAIYSRDEVPSDLKGYVDGVLTEEVRKEKFQRYAIPELSAIIDDVQRPVDVATVRWTDEGERESMADILTGVSTVLTFLIYMFVLSYGAMVMQSVTEEKVNRIVELMVSSVKPFQLMMGKIIGIGLVGLFQMLLWGVLLAGILFSAAAVSGAPMVGGGVMDEVLAVLSQLPVAEICVLFVLYFVGGYLLYASILAAMGASVNDMQDSQQFMMPVVVVMIFTFYVGMYGAGNPDGSLALWCSYIPFTSPIVMMVRIPFGVPVYEEAISVGVLYASALVLLKLSAKIYRTGILMYGKKVSFREMLRWIRH